MVDTDVLATIPLFASLDKPQLDEIARCFEPRSVSPGPGDFFGEGSLLGTSGRRHAPAS